MKPFADVCLVRTTSLSGGVVLPLLMMLWLLSACGGKEDPVPVPVLETLPVDRIEPESAMGGGRIISDGDDLVTEKGLVWSRSPDPTLSDKHSSEGMGANTYQSQINNLSPNTTYFVRAYAINSHGVGYGNEVIFTSHPPNIYDIDGNKYHIKSFGEQVWMTENLYVSRLRDGTPIEQIHSNTQWFQATEPAYSYYNKDEAANKLLYGALYNWVAVESGKLCPVGWRVPADADWLTLEVYLGMSVDDLLLFDWRGELTNSGGVMKSRGTELWLSPNVGATNSSEFNGLPGGYRDLYGSYRDVGRYARWWTSTEMDSLMAISRRLNHLRNTVFRGQSIKRNGYAVRCIKERNG